MLENSNETTESYDVIIVGAGIGGINFAYRLEERCPHLKYIILEARHEMGGTWSLFNYPGIRSDSDLHTFGFAWRPWSEQTSIAEGHLIKSYVKESANLCGVDQKIRYGNYVNSADYSSEGKSWHLDVTVDGNDPKRFRSRWILLCTGYYDYKTPLHADIPGIGDFRGEVIHPQFWPEDLDYTGKDVVVIGSGATAVTIVPNMAEKASRVTMLQRSPAYIIALPREDFIERCIRRLFWWFPMLQYFLFRWKWILYPLAVVYYSTNFPMGARYLLGKMVDKELPASIPRDPHFTPKYNPWEQRLCVCPDGDFFQSLRSGKADVLTDKIERITEKTIQLQSGKVLHPDIIVTATGLKLQFAGGMKISVDGEPFKVAEKFIWKGLMLQDLPNAAFVFGYVDASWTLGADATAQLVTRMFSQMHQEGVREIKPVMSPAEKKNVVSKSILRLTSTYVEKGNAVMPKSGDRGQWSPRSHFIRDILQARFGDIRAGTEWTS